MTSGPGPYRWVVQRDGRTRWGTHGRRCRRRRRSNSSPTRSASRIASARSMAARSAADARRSVVAITSGSRGSAVADPGRHLTTVHEAQAYLGGVPVGQAPQRCGDVGVRGGDRAVVGIVRHRAVKGGVAAPRMSSAAWSTSAAPRGSAGSTPAMTRPTLAPSGQGTPSPAAATRSRSTAAGVGVGMVRSRPSPPSSMMLAADMPVEQRDLGVPLLGRDRGTQHQAPVGAVGLELLLRDRQVDGAAVEAAFEQEPTELRQQRDRVGQRARVGVGLHGRVVELGAAAHQRPLNAHARSWHRRRRGRWSRGRPGRSGRAAGSRRPRTGSPGAVAPCRRAGRRSVRGARSRPPGRRRARRTRRRRRSHSGRGTRRLAASEVHRLIQVARGRRVDGDEGHIGAVGAGSRPVGPRRARAASSASRWAASGNCDGQFQLAAQCRRSRCGALGQSGNHVTLPTSVPASSPVWCCRLLPTWRSSDGWCGGTACGRGRGMVRWRTGGWSPGRRWSSWPASSSRRTFLATVLAGAFLAGAFLAAVALVVAFLAGAALVAAFGRSLLGGRVVFLAAVLVAPSWPSSWPRRLRRSLPRRSLRGGGLLSHRRRLWSGLLGRRLRRGRLLGRSGLLGGGGDRLLGRGRLRGGPGGLGRRGWTLLWQPRASRPFGWWP